MTQGTDTVAVLPVVKDLTYNEIHSVLLGLVGVLVGAGFRLGFEAVAAGFTVCVVLVAFGLRRMSGDRLPVARRVIRQEPWYFLVSYLLATLGAAATWPVVA